MVEKNALFLHRFSSCTNRKETYYLDQSNQNIHICRYKNQNLRISLDNWYKVVEKHYSLASNPVLSFFFIAYQSTFIINMICNYKLLGKKLLRLWNIIFAIYNLNITIPFENLYRSINLLRI